MNDIMKRSRNSQVEILGRAFVYDTGDPDTIDLWEHDFEPMGEDGRSRSGADWALEHLFECGNALRSMFNLPAEGNFQVLFKGRMEGWWCGEYGGADEWDQDFIVFEFTTKPIPEEYMKFLETAT